MAKKMLDKRGVRRMLVTTLGRIERLERAIVDYAQPSKWNTAEKRAKIVDDCKADLEKQRVKLREYNEMARQIIAAERFNR